MTTLKEFLERMERDRKKIKSPPKTWDRQDPSVWFDKRKDITTPKKIDGISLSLEAFHMAQVHGDWNLVTECLRKQRLRLDGDRTTPNPRLV